MISRQILAVASLALVSAACATGIDITRTTPVRHFVPTCEAGVTVLDSRARITSDYYEIAYITAEGNAVWTDNEDLVKRMKESAAEVGATAIVANVSGPSATTAQILGAAVGTGDAERQGSALAIHQPSELARVRAACASDPSR
ncbi:MAG: hypothetical protein WEA80_08915 [Gemmatimonadaceae bacterium]